MSNDPLSVTLSRMARSLLFLTDVPGLLTVDEFWELFGIIEHENLDFKRGVPDSLNEVIPAMAMTNGGLVVCGVNDDREIVGCTLTQSTQDRIMRYSNECNVAVALKSITVGDHELLIIEVPDIRGRIVTTPNGRLLRRVGGDSQPLRGDSLARFVSDRCQLSAEEEPLNRTFNPADFDLSAVNEVLVSQGRPAVDATGLGRALADLKLAESTGTGKSSNSAAANGEFTVLTAAALLFAFDPRQFVAGAEVQLVRRIGVGPGLGPVSDRESCASTLLEVLNCCLGFIASHTSKYEVVSQLLRETIHEYPLAVVREAVLNALAHRDYGLVGATVDISVWDDRIEIRSPGSLPGHITEENMRVEHFSRNRRLMGVLRAMGLIEEFGEGVDRMYLEMEARLMPPPEFKSTEGSVTVTLRNQYRVDIEEQAWLGMLDPWPGSTAERLALVEVRRYGQVPRRQFVELLPGFDVDTLLASMINSGMLVRVGRGGGVQYQLSPAVLRKAGSASFGTMRQRREVLLDEMTRRGSLSSTEASKILREDSSSARRLLNAMREDGLVRAEGNTRARRYFPTRPTSFPKAQTNPE